MASSCFKVVNVFFFVVNGQVTKTLRRDQTIHHCLISPLRALRFWKGGSTTKIKCIITKKIGPRGPSPHPGPSLIHLHIPFVLFIIIIIILWEVNELDLGKDSWDTSVAIDNEFPPFKLHNLKIESQSPINSKPQSQNHSSILETPPHSFPYKD